MNEHHGTVVTSGYTLESRSQRPVGSKGFRSRCRHLGAVVLSDGFLPCQNRAHALEVEAATAIFDLRDLSAQGTYPVAVDLVAVRQRMDQRFLQQAAAQRQ